MPEEYSGDHICQKCGKLFKWVYFAFTRQTLDSKNLVVEEIPNQVLVHSFHCNNDSSYNVSVNCPYCFYDNYFIFKDATTD